MNRTTNFPSHLTVNDSDQWNAYLAAADLIDFVLDEETGSVIGTVREDFDVEALIKTRSGAPIRHFVALGFAGQTISLNAMGTDPVSVQARFGADPIFLAMHFNEKKFRIAKARAAHQDVCPRCAGSGVLEEFKHIDGGVCFKCDGSGEPSSN